MSEYQQYDFVALDRSLTPKEMAELRAISTRAEITPTRFSNDYQWGDLKADPAKLVARYFDAHTYFANWGTRRLMLRIPVKRADVKALGAYFVSDAARAKVSGKHVIVDLHSEEEAPDYYDEGECPLDALAPLRAELMSGDLRAAYLAWLLAVQAEDVTDSAIEPPVPPGLSALTDAQAALVAFLRIDADLLAAAVGASPADVDDTRGLHAWAKALSPRAKDQWLARAIDDLDLALGAELRRSFRREQQQRLAPGRSVAELRAAAEEICEKRKQRAKKKRTDIPRPPIQPRARSSR
ncbi:MAG TPA: hypothetical protein VHC69_22150 [Polyangiaceae bacterium]|nr:hypothetical protein [Polyangiaceae bacterium]